MHAVLYIDEGEPGRFEPHDEDRPLEIAGQPTAVPFQVALPPDVYVLDQPVIDGTVEIERVISYGPGWAVVYRDEEGAVGTIIGWALLENGVNEQVVVPVVETAVTSVLYVMLHQDTGDPGEFGFPRSDPQILFQDRLPDPFAFNTTSGNYPVARDQQLSVSNTVTVSLAVVDTNAWVVVYNDAAGEPGEIIGRSWVPAGVNREIEVTIDPELTTTTLHVLLHLDAGTPQRFDFPDGIDIPLQRNRQLIRVPFLLFSDALN